MGETVQTLAMDRVSKWSWGRKVVFVLPCTSATKSPNSINSWSSALIRLKNRRVSSARKLLCTKLVNSLIKTRSESLTYALNVVSVTTAAAASRLYTKEHINAGKEPNRENKPSNLVMSSSECWVPKARSNRSWFP